MIRDLLCYIGSTLVTVVVITVIGGITIALFINTTSLVFSFVYSIAWFSFSVGIIIYFIETYGG